MSNLTPKQRKFITAYLRTGNGRQAALEAGYRGNDHTLRQTAYETLTKPYVKAAIAERLRGEEGMQQRLAGEIRAIAFAPVKEDVGIAAKLRALELLAKIEGMFRDEAKSTINVNVGVLADVRAMSEYELLRMLSRSAINNDI